MGYMKVLALLVLVVSGSMADVGYFWHVTDFHYDPTYSDNFWSCFDDKQQEAPAGIYGNMWCDSPWKLVESSVMAMKRIEWDVDFLLWTGDTIPHASDQELSDKFNLEIQTNISRLLKNAFPTKKIYATFGNHDYHPSDQFPSNTNQFYGDILNLWRDWIGADQDRVFLKGGYYTAKTSSGMRIIGLNTILYYTANKAVDEQGDISNQFQWLEDTLRAARRDKEKVLITAHIQPGLALKTLNLYNQQNERLVNIFREFADVIVAMHFGHEHTDGFKLLTNNAGLSIPIFYAPSVTPIRFGHAHNPAIRLIKYDRTTKRHLDFAQYYNDLEKANRLSRADWKLEYNFTSAYGVKDLSATSLKSISRRMQDRDSPEFDKYMKYYYVSVPDNQREKCDADCHVTVFCGLTEFTMGEFNACLARTTSGSSTLWTSLSLCIITSILSLTLQTNFE